MLIIMFVSYFYSSYASKIMSAQMQPRGVFRGGGGGIHPPLSYSRPPLNFQIFKKNYECMMYNSLFTII